MIYKTIRRQAFLIILREYQPTFSAKVLLWIMGLKQGILPKIWVTISYSLICIFGFWPPFSRRSDFFHGPEEGSNQTMDIKGWLSIRMNFFFALSMFWVALCLKKAVVLNFCRKTFQGRKRPNMENGARFCISKKITFFILEFVRMWFSWFFHFCVFYAN